jgi:hypothetical protein
VIFARTLLLTACVIVAASGCSSDEGSGDGAGGSGGSGGSGASGGDAANDAPVTQGCVQPGDHGNEIGVGEFCTPGGTECPPGAPLCLATAAPEEDQWFCTRLCDEATNCGADAFCLLEARGSACVPNRCVDGDAGSDAGTDAGM